jgi:hypothetical protein
MDGSHRENPTENRLYLFISGGLREAPKPYDFNAVTGALDNANALARKEPGKKTHNIRIPSASKIERLYWIDPSKLEED